MKYCTRTVTWRFQDGSDLLPNLKPLPKVIVRSPETVFSEYQSLFANEVKEKFVVFWLSSSNRVLGFEIITTGLLNSSLTHPREVFRGAIVATAAAIIIAHNHPSDNQEPSSEDLSITKQIVEAGKIIGIPVHDHIIFTNVGYTSFAERGLM